jgi:predicted CoA-substrate-specific enzyme activase
VSLKAGIDAGAVNTAIVLFERDEVLASLVMDSNEFLSGPRVFLEKMLESAGREWRALDTVTVTGRGRNRIDFAQKRSSEVVCQARGALWLYPAARTVLNLGAESSRVISLDEAGRVRSFATNDKCAAGSGLFFDSIAELMGVSLEDMGNLALKAERTEDVSSRCAVFAESEIISHIHRGVSKESILSGLHHAVVDRIMDLLSKVATLPDVAVSGGVARNPAVTGELSEKLGLALCLSAEPRIVGAIGAALSG